MVAAEIDFRALFEASPVLLLVLAPDLTVVAVTDAYLKATMLERSAVMGRRMLDLFPDDPADPANEGARNVRSSLERVVATRERDEMPIQKYNIRRPEAEGGGYEERYWSPVHSPILTSSGDLAYIVHRVEDVTAFVRERQRGEDGHDPRTELASADVFFRTREASDASRRIKESNLELTRLYRRTRELEQLKSQFFANVSHELRTPLALILGPVERLVESPAIGEAARRDLRSVARNARILLKQVNDLLDASKLDAGKMEANHAEVDLCELVRRVSSQFESLAMERGTRFSVEAPERAPAQIDPEKIERVVTNLLSNAFKFTPEDGVVRLTLRVDAAAALATLEVADSGPGVPALERDHVFERFRQLDGGTTRRFGGTGLGLAIVKDFVELHRGSVRVGDAREGGASFEVRLPLRAPEGARISSAGARSQGGEAVLAAVSELRPFEEHEISEADATKPLVLVVEDNREMNRFIRQVLAPSYRTEGAFNGREGLSKAVALTPDLILTDMMMPEMSGEAFVHAARERPELASVPIVLLTAKADDELRVRLLREGARDYVMKPFSATELSARVDNLVRAKLSLERNLALNAELVDRNARLAALAAELAAANKELDAFSYSVSHDLRAPLRAIEGFSAIVAADHAHQLDEEGRRYLDRVRAATERMSRLIDDLLGLARVSRMPVSRRRVDVTQMARGIAEELASREPARTTKVEVEEGLVVEADAQLLHIALSNLIGNAWKFTGKKEAGRIDVGIERSGERAILFVRDDGAGFDMEHAERLFAPFQRLHDRSEFEGTGVGLATVQRIVARHGGAIWAEGERGRGAVFRLTL